MANSSAIARVSRWERIALVIFFAGVAAFGGLVEYRSALLSRRMGDLGCYLRAAWAVRTGGEIYDITDDNNWHYNYPPLLAILMSPLADPPAEADHAGMMPYAISVVVWYGFSVACLVVAVQVLANALEQTSPDPTVRNQPRGCRRWWALRIVPVLVCLIPIGHSLMRGQSNPLLLAFLCATVAAVLKKRDFQAGIWLAGAVCLKIFPAFLLVYPLWRRNGRLLAGCCAGLLAGLVAVPLLTFGPARTWHHYEKLAVVLVIPGLGEGTDLSRAEELTHITSTDSQSIVATLHNTLNLDRSTRPPQASVPVRLISWLIGGCMTLLTLLAAGRRQTISGTSEVAFFGALVLIMILLCPVCHLHYFSFALPLVMALVAARWQGTGTLHLGAGMIGLFIVNAIGNALPHIWGLELLRDVGLAMYMTLALWLVGVIFVWQQWRKASTESAGQRELRGVAA